MLGRGVGEFGVMEGMSTGRKEKERVRAGNEKGGYPCGLRGVFSLKKEGTGPLDRANTKGAVSSRTGRKKRKRRRILSRGKGGGTVSSRDGLGNMG